MMIPTTQWGSNNIEMIWKGLRNDPNFINYVKNPSIEMQRYVIHENPFLFPYIDNPDYEIKKEVLQIKGRVIENMIDPTKELQILAVTNNPNVITFIKNPCEEAQMIAIEKKIVLYAFIENSTKKVALEAFLYYSKQKLSEWEFEKDKEDPLFYALEKEDKKKFFEVVGDYKKELQHNSYFQSLCQYLATFHKDWVEAFLQVMSPLTKEQENIWKQIRLKTIL